MAESQLDPRYQTMGNLDPRPGIAPNEAGLMIDPLGQFVGMSSRETAGGTMFEQPQEGGQTYQRFVPGLTQVPSVVSDTSQIRSDLEDLSGKESYAYIDAAGVKRTGTGAAFEPTTAGVGTTATGEKVTDLSGTPQTLMDYYNQIKEQQKLTSAEESEAELAGKAAAAEYEPLIREAEEKARLGKAETLVTAGERGGFMSTQFAGIAALRRTEGRTFAGAGGAIERVFSAYDRTVSDLRDQQLRAKLNAQAAARQAIQTGKREDMELARQMYNDAQAAEAEAAKAVLEQEKFIQESIRADRDYDLKYKDYQLNIQKFIAGEEHADFEDELKKNQLDVSIAGLTGKWQGADTVAEKKRLADEWAQKVGISLDQKKFDEMVKNNTFNRWAEQTKIQLEADKENAKSQGIDINGAAQRIFDGTSTMGDELKLMEGKAGQQALKQLVNNHAMVLKNESKNTNNPVYEIMSSEAFTGSLNATDRQNLDKVFMVAGQMGALKETFDKLKASGKVGAIVGKIKKYDWTDPDVAAFKAELAGIVPTVARGIYGEVGVLTDNDMANYSKAVLSIENPQEAADTIFKNMLKTLEQKATNTLKNATNAKINVSGYAGDYTALINSTREMYGGDAPKMSTNPLLYNDLEDMRSKVDADSFNSFAEDLLNDAEQNGRTEEDEFAIRKRTKELDELMAGVNMPSESKITVPSFQGVEGDTDKALSYGEGERGGQCGVFVNKTAGIRVGINKADKFKNVNKYGHKGTEGIEAGDVIVQGIGDYGHVAVVTEVKPDGSVVVTESNYNLDQRVTHGRTVKPNKIYGYLRPSEQTTLAIA